MKKNPSSIKQLFHLHPLFVFFSLPRESWLGEVGRNMLERTTITKLHQKWTDHQLNDKCMVTIDSLTIDHGFCRTYTEPINFCQNPYSKTNRVRVLFTFHSLCVVIFSIICFCLLLVWNQRSKSDRDCTSIFFLLLFIYIAFIVDN